MQAAFIADPACRRDGLMNSIASSVASGFHALLEKVIAAVEQGD